MGYKWRLVYELPGWAVGQWMRREDSNGTIEEMQRGPSSTSLEADELVNTILCLCVKYEGSYR